MAAGTLAPTILIVDDAPGIRQVFTHMLRDITSGEVVAVADAEAALAMLAARPIQLVISDYHLPDQRGDELADAIKLRSPQTKLILITADIELNDQALSPNVDACLIKPFPLRDLAAAVQALLHPAARTVG